MAGLLPKIASEPEFDGRYPKRLCPLDRSTLACPPLLPPSPAPQADTPTPRNPVCWISGSAGCFWGLHHGYTLVSIIALIGNLYYASWIVHQLGIFG